MKHYIYNLHSVTYGPAPTQSLDSRKTIPIYSSASFKWKGKQGEAKMSDLIQIGKEDWIPGNPDGILIRSTATDIVKFFHPFTHKSGGDSVIYMYEDISVQIYKK